MAQIPVGGTPRIRHAFLPISWQASESREPCASSPSVFLASISLSLNAKFCIVGAEFFFSFLFSLLLLSSHPPRPLPPLTHWKECKVKRSKRSGC